jgi:hypothetical protein
MKKNSDPSPEQIEQLTAEIRATWSPAERMKRLRADLRPHYQRCDGESKEMTADVYNGHHSERQEVQKCQK